ncbi:MAG: sugar transferase [Anaerohalosphaera sp.]|nr:sugar transferase [Anaerohalosphaera sp.]
MYPFLKRLLDICAVIPAVLLFFLPMIVISVAIRCSSKGRAIFAQTRAGKDGVPFTMLKFRTMRRDAAPFGASPKTGDDPRLTGIGKILRERSLDELPQLFNVLYGSMTLVGPRPLYISQMEEWDDTQKRRLLVKPGLTGLAQISGRGHLTREVKLALDVEYVDNATFMMDIKILFATIGQVLGKQSVYEKKYSETEYTRSKDNMESG